MALNITLAGIAIPTDAAALQSFPNDRNLAFSLDNTLAQLLDSTLANVPSSAATTTVNYTSPSASWIPGAGPVTFGLSGGVTGTLAVVTSGTLLSYTDGLDSPQIKTIPVPSNTAYLSLTLKFSISANVAGQYSGGAYGVTASASSSDSYSITWSKAFAPTTLVRDALAKVFESLVLPFHSQTLNQMSDNDYLLHEFDGNLHLSFGAYYGLDQVLYAGQSSIDVLQAFGSPLATLSGGVKPTISAGVNLSFTYQYATIYQALLSKAGGTARLHLYRSSNATSSTSLTAGLTFDANTTASIAANTGTAQTAIVNAAGGAGTPAGDAVSSVLGAAASEIAKYVAEVNDKLSSWLSRANGIKANLEVLIETAASRVILAAYDFDLTSANYPAAWQAAVNGDFVAAMATGAVTLDIGSGLESAYQSKTTFSCNFFNLWSMSTWSEFSSKVSLVYAGNNVFHLVANIGRTTETSAMGALHSLDFYFAATANIGAGGSISAADIDLHVDLTAQNNPGAAATIATMLSAIEAGPAADALASTMHAFASNSPKGTVQLQITISQAAYANITCDPYDAKGNPITPTNYNDKQNWNAFTQAAGDLNIWQNSGISSQALAYFQTFAAWIDLNEAQNGSSTPNRLDSGNIQIWPEDFPSLDQNDQTWVSYLMHGGQSFMNFCGDLVALAAANSNVSAAGSTWNSLVQMLTNAIKNDVNIDFARPAALAVIRLSNATITASGPNSAAVPASHFAVTLTM
jgi:hypothetical protein